MANKNNITIIEENQSRIPDSGIPPGNQGQGRGGFGTGDGAASGNVDYELLAEQQLERQLEIENRKALQALPIFEESKIKLDRKVYSKKKFNDAINNGFEELFRKEDTFTIEQFFKLYDNLFFDIPKFGGDSHDELRNRSNEFLDGFTSENNNTLINQLNAKILELEEQLLLASQVVPEHPLYKNNSLIKQTDDGGWRIWLMDKGFKRSLATWQDPWWKSVVKVLGYVNESGEAAPEKIPRTDSTELNRIPTATGMTYNQANSGRSTAIYQGQLKFADEIADLVEGTNTVTINQLRTRIQQLESQTLNETEFITIKEKIASMVYDQAGEVWDEGNYRFYNYAQTKLDADSNDVKEYRKALELKIKSKVRDIIEEYIVGN